MDSFGVYDIEFHNVDCAPGKTHDHVRETKGKKWHTDTRTHRMSSGLRIAVDFSAPMSQYST